MIRKKAFWKKLKKEMPAWVADGIIAPDQQQHILSLYAPSRSDMPRRLPAIVIGLAVFLIAVGIILFYAANWRKMPLALKLTQVFLLMFCLYGLAYYVLEVKQISERIGRGFLFLGMVSFGAGIILVAQIYHISAHPADGVLTWALGVLATSWIMREKSGYYLAALLLFIWNFWEYAIYQSPNYLFALFPLILLYLFYQKQSPIGSLLAVLEMLFWYYQVNLYWIDHVPIRYGGAMFFWHGIPFGLMLIALGRMSEKNATLAVSASVVTLWGWLSIFSPFFLLSWPEQWFDTLFPFFILTPLTLEYLGLLLLAIGLWYSLARWEDAVSRLSVGCLLYGVLACVLPLGNITTLALATHLGFLAFFFGLLYSSYVHFPERRIERFLAYAFPIVTILVKGVGFLAYGLDSYRFFVAYCLGFLVFGTVCLLINQTVKLLLTQQNRGFPEHILNSVCAVMGFIILYALSFKIRGQASVFEATSVVLTLLSVFLIIALGFYLFHWLKNPQKLLILLSALIFFTSVGVLLISGPSISWTMYAVIFNALLFLLTATLIYYSTRINSVTLANLAIAGFLLQVITRYFDLFWDMLSGSALFILTGLLALGGGYFLEQQRRRLLESLKKP